MHTHRRARDTWQRGCLVGVAIAVLVFSLLCPVMLPALCAGTQQTCPYQSCWVLLSGIVLPVLSLFAGLPWAMRFALLSEHPLRLFRPPRPVLLSSAACFV